MRTTSTRKRATKWEIKQQASAWTEYFQWPPALILLLAAILKSHQLSTSPYTANLVFESRLLTTVLIATELVLAFWLISRSRPKVARGVALATFAAFCVFGIIKVVSGAESCGCFGVFEIHPVVTLVLDVGMVILVTLWPASVVAKRFSGAVAATGLLCVGACLFPVLTFTTSSLSDVGQIVGDGDLIIIDTSTWVNKRLPIERFIDGDPSYMKGDWQIILYHEDCPVCQAIIQKNLTKKSGSPIVFVECSPYKSPNRIDREDLLWRKLSDEHEWFVTAPDAIDITNGVVIQSLGQIKSISQTH